MQELNLEENNILSRETTEETAPFISFETGSPVPWPNCFCEGDETGDTCCCYLNASPCPDCGGGMIRLGSCFSCPSCGYQSCG